MISLQLSKHLKQSQETKTKSRDQNKDKRSKPKESLHKTKKLHSIL